MTTSTLSQLVADLEGPTCESASRALTALGPAVVPELRRQFEQTKSSVVRRCLVEIISHFRRPKDVEFFAIALQYRNPGVWQAAIDALSSQPCTTSLKYMLRVLHGELATLNPNRRKVSFLLAAVVELEKQKPFGVGRSHVGPA